MKDEFELKFMWYPWSRYQGIGAGFFLFTGGLIGLFYPEIIISIVNTITGLVVMLLNYPVESLSILGPLYYNYYMRGILHLLLSIPAIISAPTTTPGLFMMTCGLTYIKAGFNGESYSSPHKKKASGSSK